MFVGLAIRFESISTLCLFASKNVVVDKRKKNAHLFDYLD